MSGTAKGTRFIGLERVRGIAFRTTRDERTRCYFCKNKCLRTFIDVATGSAASAGDRPAAHESARAASPVPLVEGERRLIMATCEKGTVEDVHEMRVIKQGLDDVRRTNQNLMQVAAHEAFAKVELAPQPQRSRVFRHYAVSSRDRVRIGMPRVLNMYSHAPFFIGFFASLGIPFSNLVFSDYTDEHLYKRGANGARSTRAFRASSASRTCTTCSTFSTPAGR
jgi:hypothetical protein